jgi:hypothetical protein
MADLAGFVGGLFPTFILSRLFLRALRRWDGGLLRLCVVHALAWTAGALIVQLTDPQLMFGYILPQVFWLIVDVFAPRPWLSWRRAQIPPPPDLP